VAIADLNNDGWADILYVNGHVYPEIDRVKGPTHYKQPKVLYENLGNGKFRDVSALAGSGMATPASARGCAFGDFDNDGSIDVVINPINAVPQLLHCTSKTGNNWISLKLVGTKSNRSAIGARVRLAHQDVALLRLEPGAPRRLLPAHIDIAAHQARAAGAAGPGRAFVGQSETLPQPGVEDGFPVATVEGQLSSLALDRYLHRSRHSRYLKKSSSSSPSSSNS
jgi:hypothetical protein